MKQAPTCYAEFSELLIELRTASNRRELIGLLYQGKIDWQSGIAERLTSLIFETTNVLIERMNKALNQDLRCVSKGNDALAGCLINARRWFSDMFCLAALPVLSAQTATRIREQVQEVADKMQMELENLARRNDPAGKLLMQVRQNPVNRIHQDAPPPEIHSGADSPTPTTGRRNIILP